MKRQLTCVFLFVVLIVTHVAGQQFNENNFTRYGTAEGMSHNTVSGIMQDSIGYVWIATSYGLNCFNGNRFVQFHSSNDSLSLAAEELAGMAWIDDQRLAVFTTGLFIIDTKTGRRHNLFIPYHNLQYQFKFNMMVRAIGDNKGNIYVLSRSGFYQFDKNYKLQFRFDYYSEAEVPINHFYFGGGLFELDQNRLLITSVGGLYVYDKQKRELKKMTAADFPLMSEFLNYPQTAYQFFQQKPGSFFVIKPAGDTLVYINTSANKKIISHLPFGHSGSEFGWHSTMIAASDSVFYITGHNSGFYKMHFYPESGRVKINPEKYFKSYLCNALLNDKDHNLWVATNRGLFRENNQKATVQVVALPGRLTDSFPNIRIDDIYVSTNKIYAGAKGEGGLLAFDKKGFLFEKQIMFKKNDGRFNDIRAIAAINQSTLLLGTLGPPLLFDLLSKKEKELIPPGWKRDGDWTSDLYKDHNGSIWIAADKIYRYDPLKKYFERIPGHPQVLSVPNILQEDLDGHIWMAGHGLARYNTVLNRFDMLLDSFPFIKMPDKQVNAMVIDRQNTIWFNSNNNGLISYDIKHKKYRHFTRSEGLPDDNIASLIVVDNKLWIACYSGIACLDLQTFQVASFGKEDGFPDMPIVKGAKFFYDEYLQQLYIGFTSAVARFNPNDMLKKKPAPDTFIESLAINTGKIIFLPGENISTSWKENNIRITIGCINFSDGNSQRFAYRILGDSTMAWQQLGTQPSFSISNLSPGTYNIQVKSFSVNNGWPEQVKQISITILPPFWLKPWFKIILVLLMTGFIYLLIKWRTGLVRKKEMEKTHLQKLKADDYKNQFELEQISNYFSSSLAGKKTADEVLWDVAGNLIGRMNYVDCMIYLWNEDKTKMVQKAAYGPKGKPEFIAADVFDVLPGQGIVGHVLQSRQPILVNDTRLDSRYRRDEAFRLSEICVPIIHNDELLGIIDSEHHLPGYYTERDIKIMTTIATLIGNKLKQIESERSLDAKRKELEGINEQLAEARLSALQAQMNPHFVFNALNSIKRMILDGENERASRYLSKFALMIRMTLEHSKYTFITLDENVKYLEAYLDMEKLRFDDSFCWEINTDENTDPEETLIPSLMMQPLVENAIWHGLMQAQGEKKINIGFIKDQNRIICSIEDNGIGIFKSDKLKQQNNAPHRSVGLENLRNRIKILNGKYNISCRLELTDLGKNGENKSGTIAVLSFNAINL